MSMKFSLISYIFCIDRSCALFFPNSFIIRNSIFVSKIAYINFVLIFLEKNYLILSQTKNFPIFPFFSVSLSISLYFSVPIFSILRYLQWKKWRKKIFERFNLSSNFHFYWASIKMKILRCLSHDTKKMCSVTNCELLSKM